MLKNNSSVNNRKNFKLTEKQNASNSNIIPNFGNSNNANEPSKYSNFYGKGTLMMICVLSIGIIGFSYYIYLEQNKLTNYIQTLTENIQQLGLFMNHIQKTLDSKQNENMANFRNINHDKVLNNTTQNTSENTTNTPANTPANMPTNTTLKNTTINSEDLEQVTPKKQKKKNMLIEKEKQKINHLLPPPGANMIPNFLPIMEQIRNFTRIGRFPLHQHINSNSNEESPSEIVSSINSENNFTDACNANNNNSNNTMKTNGKHLQESSEDYINVHNDDNNNDEECEEIQTKTKIKIEPIESSIDQQNITQYSGVENNKNKLENNTNNKKQCEYIFKKGKNKQKQCTEKAYQNQLCKNHCKKN